MEDKMDYKISSKANLLRNWGEDGEKVISACEKVAPFNGTSKQFLDHCIACGGDWGQMLLSGVKELYPEIWDLIPDNMGTFAFACIVDVLILLGVNTTK